MKNHDHHHRRYAAGAGARRRDGRVARDLPFRSFAALLLAVPTVACGSDQDLERPAPLFNEVPIEYPLEMWDQDIEGETLIKVRVNDVGEVDSVEVAESSGHPTLDSAAVEGAWKLRFRPARKGGERIDVWANIPVHFSKKPRPPGGR